MIALEPEAASIYCQHLPVEKLEGTNSISAFQPGSKYLVLDTGGTVVDLFSIQSLIIFETLELRFCFGSPFVGRRRRHPAFIRN